MTTRSLESLCTGCPKFVSGRACENCKLCFGATCACVGFVAMPAIVLVGALVAGLATLV